MKARQLPGSPPVLVLYFWLNLRAARAAPLEAERNGIVLDTQLAVAAAIQRGLLPPLSASRHGFN